jgi:hypothetical protein|tara:strand:- start:158 stop:919 length:762 start_codon:yes stop_codon:yes gene_type:complete
MSQHKVAFLNLSLDSFNREDVWRQFFNGGDKELFNLYIHSKNKKCPVFKDYFIENTVPTKWGHFSLVEATIELIKAALEDKQNEYFSLISDSHLPLYSLNETVELIKRRYSVLTFSKHFSFHTKVKSQRILKEGVRGYNFDKYNAVCQFFTFRRSDAEIFVNTIDQFSKYFVKDKVIFADEFYFWAIARELNIDFKMGQATTYSDWSFRELPNRRLERNPRTFSSFTRPMLYIYRKEGFLYARKAASDTVITF